jgi:hypothetical protein
MGCLFNPGLTLANLPFREGFRHADHATLISCSLDGV